MADLIEFSSIDKASTRFIYFDKDNALQEVAPTILLASRLS